MKVYELLKAHHDHIFIDIHIDQELYNCYTDNYVTTEVATWKHREHIDWYLGSLNYFSDRMDNALLQYMDYEVDSFFMINTVEPDKLPQMYIVIK